jgi:pimeloyl-ACP methyl ester carboxylesterase
MLAMETRPLVLLGHGIGGSILLEFAQHYAGEVDGLILHAPVGARLKRRLLPRLMKFPGAREFGRRLFYAPLTRPIFKRLLFSQPVPSDYLDRFFDDYRRCAVFGQMFDLITAEWFNSLQPAYLPTALLWGEREWILSIDQLQDYQRLCPNHVIRTAPDWDHFPMIEQPAAYAHTIAGLAQELTQHE